VRFETPSHHSKVGMVNAGPHSRVRERHLDAHGQRTCGEVEVDEASADGSKEDSPQPWPQDERDASQQADNPLTGKIAVVGMFDRNSR
jgi:hypothetical protein